jgi:hypothetical protein
MNRQANARSVTTFGFARKAGWLLAAALMPAVAGANCEAPEAVWINLEVVSPLAGFNEPTVWIDITRDGCLTTRYPSFDRRAGVYQRELGPAELAKLADRLSRSDVARYDSAAVRAQIAATETLRARAAGYASHFVVADGDLYRLRIDDAGLTTQIQAEAPRRFSAQFPDVAALKGLIEFVDALEAAATDPATRRVAEVTP